MYSNTLPDMEKTLPDADEALFGKVGKLGLEIEDLPPEDRSETLRRVLDEIETYYRVGSGDAIPELNYVYENTKTCRTTRNNEANGWKCLKRITQKPGDTDPEVLCLVTWRDIPGKGERPVRYALVFLDNKSPSRTRTEEIDLDIAVLAPNCSGYEIVFNESKRLYQRPEKDRFSLISEAAKISQHIMSEMPGYFSEALNI